MTKELKGINTFKVFIKEFECEGDYHGWFKYHSYGLVEIGDESLHCDVDKFIDPFGIKDSISYIYILKNQHSKDRRDKIVKHISSFKYDDIDAKIIDRRDKIVKHISSFKYDDIDAKIIDRRNDYDL